MNQIKYLLAENQMPTAWYNIQADLPAPIPPILNPGTGQPIAPADLAPLFPMALIEQEVSQERWIEIPDEVRIRKLRQKRELAGKPSLNGAFDDSYPHLLQTLCDRNPEWWRHCWSSDRGILKSEDPTIDKLLQPLESFVKTHTSA